MLRRQSESPGEAGHQAGTVGVVLGAVAWLQGWVLAASVPLSPSCVRKALAPAGSARMVLSGIQWVGQTWCDYVDDEKSSCLLLL